MSEFENAQTGAIAAPVETTAPTQEVTQDTPQESAPAEQPTDEQARDEKGRFVQKRINELTRKYHEADRRAQAVERELEQLRQQSQRAASLPPDPNEDFVGFVKHAAREEAMQFVESERQQIARQQEQQHYAAIAQQYESREAEYIAQHPDYAEAVENFVSVVGANRELGEVLMTSEHGPAVAHYLGQHLDEAVNIARLPPHLAAAAIARLEAKVSAPKHKPVTAAPAPAPRVTGASVVPKGAHDGQSIEDWMRERNSNL